MLLKDISPFVRHVRHFTVSDSTPSASKNVRTRDNRLFLVTAGDGEITVGKLRERLTRDTVVLIRAGVEYKITPSPKVSIIVVNFDFTSDFSSQKQSFHPYSSDFPGALESITLDDTDVLDTSLILHDASRFTSRIRSMLNDFYDAPEWRDAFLSATAKAVVLDLVRVKHEASRSVKGQSRLVGEVIAYLREHYADRVENETLAEHLHFTSVYVNRVFKRETGLSLRQYLISLRIDVAKELLSSGEYSPSEAATAVGFDDYPHFSKTFKKMTGRSPSEYSAVFRKL